MILNTSKAAALDVARVPIKGAALPKLKTPMRMLKKHNKMVPTEYSLLPVTGSTATVSVHPYQKPV